MIRVTIELLPGGIDSLFDAEEGENEILGVMLLDNDMVRSLGTGGKRGNYRVRLWKKRGSQQVWREGAREIRPWAETMVEDFPRKSYHSWNLVRLALNQIYDHRGYRFI